MIGWLGRKMFVVWSSSNRLPGLRADGSCVLCQQLTASHATSFALVGTWCPVDWFRPVYVYTLELFFSVRAAHMWVLTCRVNRKQVCKVLHCGSSVQSLLNLSLVF